MTRNVCVCGKVGYTKCPVHGDPVKGPAITDGEFLEMVERHKEKIIAIVQGNLAAQGTKGMNRLVLLEKAVAR